MAVDCLFYESLWSDGKRTQNFLNTRKLAKLNKSLITEAVVVEVVGGVEDVSKPSSFWIRASRWMLAISSSVWRQPIHLSEDTIGFLTSRIISLSLNL